MQQLYHVEGVLNSGFVGQITYMICLEKPYDKLDIHFSFDNDKRIYNPIDLTDELIDDTIAICREKYGIDGSRDLAKYVIFNEMKTEIHTLATLNEDFLGCLHRQLTDRHMIISKDYASEGCVPFEKIDGVLKVTVLVFNVIKDNTHYQLTVSAE